jgi:hypothetical protein
MRRKLAVCLVLCALVLSPLSSTRGDDNAPSIKSKASEILGEAVASAREAGKGSAHAQPQKTAPQAISSPEWSSSFTSSGVSAGSAGGSGSQDPCPPDVQAQCDKDDETICNLILTIKPLFGGRGQNDVNDFSDRCQKFMKDVIRDPKLRTNLMDMCEGITIADTIIRACEANKTPDPTDTGITFQDVTCPDCYQKSR